MLDFRRITLFSLEKGLSKHKITIPSKNLGVHGPFAPPATPMLLTRHLQILGSLVLAVSLCVYYLLLSISITNFMSNLKRALIVELL